MPEISRFFGIVIKMFFSDHPRPHFHAEYAEHRATFAIDTLEMLRGSLPPRIHGFVVEWAALHRTQLGSNWELARLKQPLMAIPPLE